MADLSSIVTKFEGYKDAIDGLNSFVFSDLSDINKHDKKIYKLLFLTPPDSTMPDIRIPEYEHYEVVFYVFGTHKIADRKAGTDLAKVWSECGKLAKQVLEKMRDETLNEANAGPEYVQDGVPALVRGHELHNSKLVGVQVTTIWRIHECL